MTSFFFIAAYIISWPIPVGQVIVWDAHIRTDNVLGQKPSCLQELVVLGYPGSTKSGQFLEQQARVAPIHFSGRIRELPK